MEEVEAQNRACKEYEAVMMNLLKLVDQMTTFGEVVRRWD